MAIHINHGLQDIADDWQQFASEYCEKLDIEFNSVRLEAKPNQGDSIEAWARQQRYQVFQTLTQKQDMLLTGHHRDDQAETVLLQLFRGAGPEGLAAMPFYTTRNGYAIARPLLNVQRRQIKDYAEQHSLDWIEDTSNQDTTFDRNYLRHRIMPELRKRWPQMDKTLQRVSSHQSEAVEILSDIAEEELGKISDDKKESIDLDRLVMYPETKQKLIIRHWIKYNGFSLPSEKVLHEIFNSLLNSEPDKQPLVHWSGCEVRRYINRLYIMLALTNVDPSTSLNWLLPQEISLSLGNLSAESKTGHGIRASLVADDTVTVKYRSGGERLKPSGSACHRTLKNLYQEASVLPWMRDKIPLIYKEDDLICVPGLWTADHARCQSDEPGWLFHWQCKRRVTAISK